MRGSCAVLLWLALFAASAQAHDARPLVIEIVETQPLLYRVEWKAPHSLPRNNVPRVLLPASCEMRSATFEIDRGDAWGRRFAARCREELAGHTIEVSFPSFNPAISTLLRLRWRSGERVSKLLDPSQTAWTIPASETASSVARDYARLGIAHIWRGPDHLLFLACLTAIAGTGRRILITISGFTIAHSITLIAAALGAVRVAVPPVEAAIALSILLLATEIVAGRRDTLTWKHPIAVSSSFGLLHGLGFAAALREIGLPQTELWTGLLFFNIGVEIGQIAFVAAAAILLAVLKSGVQRLTSSTALLASPGRAVVGYVVGGVSAYLFIDRFVAFFPLSSAP
ncbi:MAG: HupE/UreJ family protein [Deltaproteobacteria bacterium]|nr:HupE/UreJ family protein [Deltaproteobacteria bacterium]